jgi:flagellar hook-associated protein 3 FlgL
MRITNQMTYNRVLRNLQMTEERLSKSQERVASQKSISKPSEDPIGLSRIMTYHRDINRIQQTIRNAESASDVLSQTDAVLQKVGDLMNDARNKAVIMATDTVSAEARSATADEVQSIIEQIMQQANTKLEDRYIFSGNKILIQPYNVINDQIQYAGDQNIIQQRVGLNAYVTVNIPGSDLFGSSDSGLFKVLESLRDAMKANNQQAIADSISSIDEGIDRISSALGTIGARTNTIEINKDELNNMELSLTGQLSKIEDVDMAVESTGYTANQNAYQAALEVAASVLKRSSLLDYLS